MQLCVLASSSHGNNKKLKRWKLACECVCLCVCWGGGGCLLSLVNQLKCLFRLSNIRGRDIQYIMWKYEATEMVVVTYYIIGIGSEEIISGVTAL